MKIKIGDKVKFLNDTGEGVLLDFVDKKTALVRIEGGFDIPVMITELVSYGGDYFTDSKEEEEKPVVRSNVPPVKKKDIAIPQKKKEKAIEIPDDEVVFTAKPSLKYSGINTWLVNSSSWIIKYVVSRPVDEGHKLFAQGELEADTKVLLGRFLPENTKEIYAFDFQFILYKSDVFIKKEPLTTRVFVEPEGIYNGQDLHENDYFSENAFVLNLIDFKRKRENKAIYPDLKSVQSILSEKNDVVVKAVKEKKLPLSDKPEEVDLHIENLIDDHRNLSNGEILTIQMARFKTALDTAIIHKTPKIVFIHGVGNGKLKFEIRRTLEQKYPKLQFQDASFREYGFGATMVLIR
jgi:hypothetical protein